MAGVKRLLPILLSGLVLLLVFWEVLVSKLSFLLNLTPRSGDVLQHLSPFWRYYFENRNDPLSSDYVTQYYLDAILPTLYKGIFWFVCQFTEPVTASAYLTISLHALIFLSLTAASLRVSRSYVFGFVVAGLVLNSLLLGGLWNTALERTFGAALLSFSIYLLAHERVRGISVTALIAVMIYPPVALIILGMYLVIYAGLIWQRKGLKGIQAKHLFQPILILFLFGVCAAPQIFGGVKYGERLTLADADEYPEVGPGGRLSSVDQGRGDFSPRRVFKANLNRYLFKFSGDNKSDKAQSALLWSVSLLLAMAISLLVFKKPKLEWVASVDRSLLMLTALPVSMICCTVLASVVFPLLYIPSRYLSTGAAPVILLIMPLILWCGLGRVIAGRIRDCFMVSIFSLMILTLHGGLPTPKKNQKFDNNRFAQVDKALKALPTDALIAGWPRGAINWVPLVSGRSAFITEETHQVFHLEYVNEMRKRISVLIKLFCNADDKVQTEAILSRLRSEWGVSHLFLDKSSGALSTSYFKPFIDEISQCPNKFEGLQKILISTLKERIIYDSDRFTILATN